MNKNIISLSKSVLFSIIFCFSVTSTASSAESSGWVTPTQMSKFSSKMNKKDMMPTSIKCKGDSKSSSVRDSMLINMTFSSNPKRKKWRWVWGNKYGATKHSLEKSGWKQVSSSGFVRPNTGLNVRCGIFHAQ